MTKYNKSEIMKNAWSLYRMNANVVERYKKSFGECLKQAWEVAKYNVEIDGQLEKEIGKKINSGLVWMRKVNSLADAGRPGWIVTGKTFGAKTELRKMGFRWDAEGRCWATDDRKVARAFAAC